MRYILHVFPFFNASVEAMEKYAIDNNVDVNYINMTVTIEDTCHMFRKMETKEDAYKVAAFNFEDIVYDPYPSFAPYLYIKPILDMRIRGNK